MPDSEYTLRPLLKWPMTYIHTFHDHVNTVLFQLLSTWLSSNDFHLCNDAETVIGQLSNYMTVILEITVKVVIVPNSGELPNVAHIFLGFYMIFAVTCFKHSMFSSDE